MNTKPMGGLLRARRSMSYMAFLPLLLFCLRDCADSADFDLQKRMVLFSYGSVRTRSTKRLDYPVWKQTDNFAQKKNRTKAPPGRWQLARTQPSSVYANTESARATSASRGKTRHAVSKRKHRPAQPDMCRVGRHNVGRSKIGASPLSPISRQVG